VSSTCCATGYRRFVRKSLDISQEDIEEASLMDKRKNCVFAIAGHFFVQGRFRAPIKRPVRHGWGA
jgi:hypothetical protein